jgi:predicted metal-dependent phosphoesterase TrpH
VLVDLHAHTAPRSSCSRATLEDLVAAARTRGVDALCLTEHDVAWPADELAAASRLVGMPLLAGVELSTDVGHVLAYGPLRRPLWAKYRLEQLVEEAEDGEIALVLPHPVRREAGERAARAGRTPPVPAEVAARTAWRHVHAVEAASTQTTTAEHDLVAAALLAAPRPAVAGSDAHAPKRAGTFATRFQRPVRSTADLVEELRAGRVAPVRLDGEEQPNHPE